MKISFIVTSLCGLFISFPCLSQETSIVSKPTLKGNIILGGNFKFDLTKNFNEMTYSGTYPVSEKYTSNGVSLSIGPQLGYFLIDGLAIGISPSFSYSHSKFTTHSGSLLSDSKSHSLGWGVNVFAKYYLKNCIFFEFETGYLNAKVISSSSDPETYNTYSIIPSVGYAIFLNSKVAIEPMINYEFNFTSNKYSNLSWYKQSANGISLSAQYILFF